MDLPRSISTLSLIFHIQGHHKILAFQKYISISNNILHVDDLTRGNILMMQSNMLNIFLFYPYMYIRTSNLFLISLESSDCDIWMAPMLGQHHNYIWKTFLFHWFEFIATCCRQISFHFSAVSWHILSSVWYSLLSVVTDNLSSLIARVKILITMSDQVHWLKQTPSPPPLSTIVIVS